MFQYVSSKSFKHLDSSKHLQINSSTPRRLLLQQQHLDISSISPAPPFSHFLSQSHRRRNHLPGQLRITWDVPRIAVPPSTRRPNESLSEGLKSGSSNSDSGLEPGKWVWSKRRTSGSCTKIKKKTSKNKKNTNDALQCFSITAVQKSASSSPQHSATVPNVSLKKTVRCVLHTSKKNQEDHGCEQLSFVHTEIDLRLAT